MKLSSLPATPRHAGVVGVALAMIGVGNFFIGASHNRTYGAVYGVND